ncbi:MAG: DNRLRE domain-containing protein, partial [Chloroflexota bacterium]
APEATGAAASVGAGRWVSLDVREAVAQWLTHPEENHGLLVRGQGGAAVEHAFASAQWEQPAQRPKLVITYELAPERRLALVERLGPWQWAGLALGPLALVWLLSRGVRLARARQESKRRVR